MAVKSAKNQRGRPFQKGQSGNPGGKPRGTRARVTVLGEKIMQDNVDDIVKSVVEAAKNGDACAMRLCVERLIPVRKGRPVKFDLPAIETPADIASALGAVAGAMAEGELTPDEANAVAGVIEFRRRAIETVEHEERIRGGLWGGREVAQAPVVYIAAEGSGGIKKWPDLNGTPGGARAGSLWLKTRSLLLACHDTAMGCFRDALNCKLHGRLWHEYLEQTGKLTRAPLPCCSTRSIAIAGRASRKSRSRPL